MNTQDDFHIDWCSDQKGAKAFPYNPRTTSTAFRRACADLEIDNLHFHDLRHEATRRLFEAVLEIQQVVLVTGHKDWRMLKRYPAAPERIRKFC